MSTQLWTPIKDLNGFEQDARHWLATHMSADMPWLLVHADDGVIWGRREPNGSLLLSSDVFAQKKRYPAIAVELRALTLQQCRIFGKGGELLIWREGSQFCGRAVRNDNAAKVDSWDEQHLLWGTRVVEEQQGFSLFEEGQQGPQHAISIAVPRNRRAALTVRHYVEQDEHGQAVVVMSRLVDLGLYQPQKES
ncbi:MAG: CRISPR-associated protein [Chloroflexota bacterium]|nr:TIGR03984 family CRISPR-associated protein [Caldilinea sp.]GIK72745.1 MAG: CRISPR-associated protein [Chloroflexota bacterium]